MPTAAPIKIGYIVGRPFDRITPTPIGADGNLAGGTATPVNIHLMPVQAAIQRAAQEFGWSFELAPPEALRTLAQSASVIVVDDATSQATTRAVAAEFPKVYFVGVNQSAVEDPPPNLLMLGGPPSRQDQAGFLAGMAAGLATQTRKVAVVGDPATAEGLKYRNGFLHGVRYACPRCRVDFIDVANTDQTTWASEEAARYALYGTDVFFGAAGPAGDAALTAAAENGAWALGSVNDAYATFFNNGAAPGADRVLTSVYLDAGEALYTALASYHAGKPLSGVQPLSATTGAIVLAPVRDKIGALTALDQADLAAALARLADGSLDTGIDPLTGEER